MAKVLVIDDGCSTERLRKAIEEAGVLVTKECKVPVVFEFKPTPLLPILLLPTKRGRDRSDPAHPRNAFRKK